MIEIRGISKRFAGKLALEPFHLEIAKGEIFGLLGHNGAGKSTTLGILLGHIRPDEGEVLISGISVQRERTRALRRIGAIFETPCFYDYMSGMQNLRYFVSLSGGSSDAEIARVLELVGLTTRISDRVSTYSHGMRQRLALAQALLPLPEFLVLDEPNDGLDPEGIQEMRGLLLKLNIEHGMTLLFSSHILAEVEHLCKRIAILNHGRQVFCGSWQEAAGSKRRIRLKFKNGVLAQPVLDRIGATKSDADFYLMAPEIDLAEVISALAVTGAGLFEASEDRPSLEDFYMGRIQS